jgi:hypothetical protein
MLLVATYFAGFVTSQKLAEKALREAEEKAAAELAAAKASSELSEVLLWTRGMNSNQGGSIKIWDLETGIAEPPTTAYRYRDPSAPQGAKGP